MEILFGILCILLETAFVFIGIKSMKRESLPVLRNILLFTGITTANLLSGILTGNVFRYLLLVTLYFITLKLIYKKNSKFHDIFAINIILFIKYTAEFILFGLFIKDIYNLKPGYMVIFGLLIALIPLILNKKLNKIYDKIVSLLKRSESFYLRYGLCVMMTLAVMLYYYGTYINLKGEI